MDKINLELKFQPYVNQIVSALLTQSCVRLFESGKPPQECIDRVMDFFLSIGMQLEKMHEPPAKN